MNTETTETPTPTTISLDHQSNNIVIYKDGEVLATFDWEPKASIAVEFLHTLDSKVMLWDSLESDGTPIQFDDKSRDLLENVRLLLNQLLWRGIECVKVYRLDPPGKASNGDYPWAIRRYRDGAILVHRQETIHAFAARCFPPNEDDPHPQQSTPDLEPRAWAEWFERNAGRIQMARVADYNQDLWFPCDWSTTDALRYSMCDVAVEMDKWKMVEWKPSDQYELAC